MTTFSFAWCCGLTTVFTDLQLPLQKGVITLPGIYDDVPHCRMWVTRTIEETHEVLDTLDGRVAIDFYSSEGSLVGGTEPAPVDTELLTADGHVRWMSSEDSRSSKCRISQEKLPISEWLSDHGFCLPSSTNLTEDEADGVCLALDDARNG